MQSGSHAIKLGMLGITTDPYMTPKDAWDYNPSRWPDVSFPDICVYFIHTPSLRRVYEGSKHNLPVQKPS